MSLLLERFLYGPTAAGTPDYALSPGVSAREAVIWNGLASLEPPEDGDAYGLFGGPSGSMAFLRASWVPESMPVREFLLLPKPAFVALGGDLGPLVQALLAPATALPLEHAPAELPDPQSWPPADRRAAIETFLGARDGAIGDLWSLFGMAIHERGLMIYGAAPDGLDRLRLVQVLSALLPASARPLLTFTTHRAPETHSATRIAFARDDQSTGRWIARWNSDARFPEGAQDSPYVRLLQAEWTGDVDALLVLVDSLEGIASRFADGRSLQALLGAVAERHALDRRVLRGESVAPEQLRQALQELAPQDGLGLPYYSRLLEYALEARDTDAALLVTRAMDADATVDEALMQTLSRALQDQPDAVYAFVRVRVAVGEGNEARWLDRLREAANAALSVAVGEGDVEVVRDWLRLLIREPLSYGLTPALDAGLDTALALGRTAPDLARTMLVVAAKRLPDAFDRLLNDELFVAGLPAGLQALLCAGQCQVLQEASAFGVELLLAALARGAAVQRSDLFTPETMTALWSVAYGSQALQIAEPFSAPTTITHLVTEPFWLPPEAASVLLASALSARQDSLFYQALQAWSGSEAWREVAESILEAALVESRRPMADVVAILGNLVSGGQLGEQAALTITLAILDDSGWTTGTLPLAVQAARAAQRGLVVSDEAIWKLLDLARTERDEAVARDAARCAVAALEAEQRDEIFVPEFARLTGVVRWNAPTSAAVMSWWRNLARSLPTARLARLDKAFETEPELGEARAVTSSLLALRRLIGNRSLAQFSVDVASALALLQSFDEAYVRAGRREAGFDPDVVRMDVAERLADLAPSDVRLLSNQLAALAQLVGELGDSRTRPALLRREDADVQLARGEAEPHSAVDALKWLSGYLSGAHPEADEARS